MTTSSTSPQGLNTTPNNEKMKIIAGAGPSGGGSGSGTSGSSNDCCTCSSCAPISCSNVETLSLFKTQVYDGDFILTGIGTRDTGGGDIHVTTIPDGATVKEAYLYWNTIEDDCHDSSLILFQDIPIVGVCKGYAANTCWSPCENSPGTAPYELHNHVYRATVTTYVTGNGKYNVDALPYSNGKPNCEAANQPQYPGCAGSQGVALLIIYSYGDCSGPNNNCRCREISIYEGAVMIASPGPPFPGTSTETLVHNTNYYGNVRLGFGIGDVQEYTDSATFNSKPINGSGPGNAFGHDEGNLLFAHAIPVGLGEPTNLISISSSNDCICWFLLAFSGNNCPCVVQAQLNGDGSGFSTNSSGQAVSIGEQYATPVVISDPCGCLPSSSSLYLIVNNEPSSQVPPVYVFNGDTIDIKVNTSKCDVCSEGPMFCQGTAGYGDSGTPQGSPGGG